MRSKRVQVPMICQQCKKEHSVDIDQVRRGWGKFCSRPCVNEFLTESRQAKNGTNVLKKTLNARARKLWIKRHGGALPICWCGDPADIHHQDGNKANNDPGNLEPLCRSHHVSYENAAFPRRRKQVA